MAISSWSAGIIRPVAVAPTGPYQDGAAPGVWTLDEAAFWTKQGLWPTAGNLSGPVGTRGVFFGGYAGGTNNVIDYIDIASAGNALDFGDLTVHSLSSPACGSATRGVKAGGLGAGFSSTNVIEYITFATTGNATDFGDMLSTDSYFGAGCNSSTRGLFGGSSTPINVIQYITIATTGNATDFGDLSLSRGALGACSSSTRGVWAGGTAVAGSNVIDYVTIATTGNATDFGDLLLANEGGLAGCGSSTRGLFAGGTESSTRCNTIQYITIASTGNSTDFGDLTEKPNNLSACSSASRGVFGGGEKTDPAPSGKTNVITFVTIASIGNATDFGDLSAAKDTLSATSNGNGGL